jgi:hypothetical protein
MLIDSAEKLLPRNLCAKIVFGGLGWQPEFDAFVSRQAFVS